jgi:hypothetical protein
MYLLLLGCWTSGTLHASDALEFTETEKSFVERSLGSVDIEVDSSRSLIRDTLGSICTSGSANCTVLIRLLASAIVEPIESYQILFRYSSEELMYPPLPLFG